jgi:hypothetical protein
MGQRVRAACQTTKRAGAEQLKAQSQRLQVIEEVVDIDAELSELIG